MIKNRNDLREYIEADRKQNNVSTGIRYRLQLFKGNENAHAFRYLKTLRFCEYFYNNRSNWLFKILYHIFDIKRSRYGLRYHIFVPLNKIGKGLRIVHLGGGGGVFLNCNSMGDYCGVNSGVLLGNKDAPYARPTIGNHVAFGPGAKAIGSITIGNHSFIAANAVVVKDIPANCIVGGIPAKIIRLRDIE